MPGTVEAETDSQVVGGGKPDVAAGGVPEEAFASLKGGADVAPVTQWLTGQSGEGADEDIGPNHSVSRMGASTVDAAECARKEAFVGHHVQAVLDRAAGVRAETRDP
jgi:hypothetical protein